MIKNKIQLNESKIKFVLFGKLSDLKKIETPVKEIKSSKIVPSQKENNVRTILTNQSPQRN